VSTAATTAASAEVEIDCWQDPTVQLPAGLEVRRCIEAAFAAAGRVVPALGLRWVGAAESAELNHRYRGKPGPTNVLAFPAPSLPGLPDGEFDSPGDIVICVPVLEAEAAAQGKTARAHAMHLLVHGCLHLAGYDHDSGSEAERMERLEAGILVELGCADPYRMRPEGSVDE